MMSPGDRKSGQQYTHLELAWNIVLVQWKYPRELKTLGDHIHRFMHLPGAYRHRTRSDLQKNTRISRNSCKYTNVEYRLSLVSYDWLACGTWLRNVQTSVNYDWRSLFLLFRNWKLSEGLGLGQGRIKVGFGWRRGSVVRTSVFGWQTSLIYVWSVVEMWPLRG